MMMSKPQEAQEDVSPPAFTTPVPQLSSVEDLERRLKLIGNANPAPVPALAPPVEVSKPFAVPPPTAPEASVKSGKTALLARIKAAKEKTQQAQGNAMLKPPPAPKQEIDLLSDFDAPARADDPPPFYDTNFLPPPPPMEAPPPAFDATLQFAPPPPLNSSLPPPPPMDSLYDMPPPVFMPPPEASAPYFEDLLGSQQHYGDTHNLLDMPTPLPPPPDIDEDILAALDPAERQAILEEQRKILEQIEKERSNDDASSAAARAMAFDQRSSAAVAKVAGQYDSVPASRARTTKPKSSPPSYKSTVTPGMVDLGSGEQVPLHGQEKTQKAIQDGTALIVQCLNCQNWMQVTKDATLMFCPTCQVVSPVLAEEAATPKDMEKAAQLAADAQLAEKLQAEEYGQTQASSSVATRSELRVNNQKRIAKLEKGKAMEQSWYDWFMGSSTNTTTATQPAKPTPDRGSAEIRRGLVAASTGEESYGRGSYDESDRLMGGVGGGGARVAESKGMFACVADAVGSAVYAMNQDEEGNVHGVDASGLLAMPNVSRQRD